MPHRYLLALGSNVRRPSVGKPRRVLRAALEALETGGLAIEAVSPIVSSAPLGPSARRYANAAAIVSTDRPPEAMLALAKRVERQFGRRAGGRRWGARVLDIDLVLWSGGIWASDALVVPHPAFRERAFVLGPAAVIARDWRDPLSSLTIGQLHARLTKPRALPR